jgi:hypothetical protein
MPMIQLIKRDSSVIELEASNIQISVQRNVLVHPIPLLATRAGLDLNQPQVGITIDGILTDDETSSGSSGAEFSIDFSSSISSSGATSWHSSLEAADWAAVRAELDGVAITFKVKGQVDANLQEATELVLYNGVAPTYPTPTGLFRVICNIASTTDTNTLSTAIMASLNAGSTLVNGSGVALSTLITVSQSRGQNALMSAVSQLNNLNASPYTLELLTIRNIASGENGNSSVSVRKYQNGVLGNWSKQFFVTNMVNGVTGVQMTKGDKLQDLLNSIINPSVGGALISPQVLTGSLIDLPDSIASFDSAQFLNIDSAKSVKKMIVGVRIPYETLLSSTSGNRELRQFLIPAGPGTDHSAESNTQPFDPSETINGKVIRPNPFLQQGVAIPVVVQSFDPGYEAGDSVWTYQISLAPVEQLVGL